MSNSILIPLLNAERLLPICLYPYNFDRGINVLKREEPATLEESLLINTSILPPDKLRDFHIGFKKVTQEASTYELYKNGKWTKAFSTTKVTDFTLPWYKQYWANKGPWVIFVEGKAVKH